MSRHTLKPMHPYPVGRVFAASGFIRLVSPSRMIRGFLTVKHIKPNKTDAYDAYIGARVRKLRTIKGAQEAALARDIGVSHGHLAAFERGARIPISKLAAIAEALNVTPTLFYVGIAEAVPPTLLAKRLAYLDKLHTRALRRREGRKRRPVI